MRSGALTARIVLLLFCGGKFRIGLRLIKQSLILLGPRFFTSRQALDIRKQLVKNKREVDSGGGEFGKRRDERGFPPEEEVQCITDMHIHRLQLTISFFTEAV